MKKGGAAKGTKYMKKGGAAKGTKYKGGRIGKTKGVARGMGAAIRGGDFSI